MHMYCCWLYICKTVDNNNNQLCFTGVSKQQLRLINSWPSFRVELEFRSVGFWGEGKTGVPVGKRLGAEKQPTENGAHIWSELRIEPGPHRCEASALTTTPRVRCFSVSNQTIVRWGTQPIFMHISAWTLYLTCHLLLFSFVRHNLCVALIT